MPVNKINSEEKTGWKLRLMGKVTKTGEESIRNPFLRGWKVENGELIACAVGGANQGMVAIL